MCNHCFICYWALVSHLGDLALSFEDCLRFDQWRRGYGAVIGHFQCENSKKILYFRSFELCETQHKIALDGHCTSSLSSLASLNLLQNWANFPAMLFPTCASGQRSPSNLANDLQKILVFKCVSCFLIFIMCHPLTSEGWDPVIYMYSDSDKKGMHHVLFQEFRFDRDCLTSDSTTRF